MISNEDEQTIEYVQPTKISDVSECTFYHRMDVPGLGVVGGQWDLRHCTDEYMGSYDVQGKRVLDVGAASGYMSFEMEKRGAEVVSFDMASGAQWDLVPRRRDADADAALRRRIYEAHSRMVNGYWLLYEKLGSKARVYHGDIYNLPAALGSFDVVFLGMVLSHLRDPFRALESAARLSREAVIVTNQVLESKQPVARFVPERGGDDDRVWWIPSGACIEAMLGVLGYEVSYTVHSKPVPLAEDRKGRDVTCTSFVALKVD